MKNILFFTNIVGALLACSDGATENTDTSSSEGVEVIELPPPRQKGMLSLEETLAKRRSIRSFTKEAVSKEHLSQLFWAAQGITNSRGKRTAPSAGALYPMEIYAITKERLYHYVPRGHQIEVVAEKSMSQILKQHAGNMVARAPLVFLIAAVYERTKRKYRIHGDRYVVLEAGHIAQNLCLQAVALGLGSVPVGAFNADGISNALGLRADHLPLYLIPVGHPSQ